MITRREIPGVVRQITGGAKPPTNTSSAAGTPKASAAYGSK